MASNSEQQNAKRIFIFDSPRTCSQLFYKLFSAHQQLGHIMNPTILGVTYGPERLFLNFQHCQAAEEAHWRNAEKANMPDETYAVMATRLQRSVEEADEKGKIPLIKEHAVCSVRRDVMKLAAKHGLHNPLPKDQYDEWNNNPSPFTDELFRSFTPVLLIRHPALMQPSFYIKQKNLFFNEAWDEEYAVLTSLCWPRMMFDCYTKLYEQGLVQSRPIIVDACDVVNHTNTLLPKLCHELGIDPAGVQYQWDPIPKDQWPADPCMQEFYKEILSSSGVNRTGIKPEEERIDLESKAAEWSSLFGEKTAEALRARVKAEVGNYEYLKQFKLEC
ncbi:hypothetical protein M409DRAFT_23487 [Zasmidium cellare ATCC 36951]|uniref:Sulfotransferase domain-containing protein n=1 Tax=Zasmidium cellare ATCC 36951 TaxID=1080233 RepID=A0A6A6CGB7_ZASCE|nr:uncharacterized protein M409DRAFT_23487 [Zasmidium cellare ATCC 36951]KAF2166297.1 hypothetical protein M409DRAFT_23487 [Zasmidium cellare ATCC 36951]